MKADQLKGRTGEAEGRRAERAEAVDHDHRGTRARAAGARSSPRRSASSASTGPAPGAPDPGRSAAIMTMPTKRRAERSACAPTLAIDEKPIAAATKGQRGEESRSRRRYSSSRPRRCRRRWRPSQQRNDPRERPTPNGLTGLTPIFDSGDDAIESRAERAEPMTVHTSRWATRRRTGRRGLDRTVAKRTGTWRRRATSPRQGSLIDE